MMSALGKQTERGPFGFGLEAERLQVRGIHEPEKSVTELRLRAARQTVSSYSEPRASWCSSRKR